MKLMRPLLLLCVIGICLWIALPVMGQEPPPPPTGGASVPVPTPDFAEIAPAQPLGAVIAPELTPAPAAAQAGATATPALDEAQTAYVLDLWLDGSPNLAGINPFNKSNPSLTAFDKGKPALVGGFLYKVTREVLNSNSNETTAQAGWFYTLLDYLTRKDTLEMQGSVRLLRFGDDAMVGGASLQEIAAQYDVDVRALRRDAMTYQIFDNNAVGYGSFFADLISTKPKELRTIAKARLGDAGYFLPGAAENIRIKELAHTETQNNQAVEAVGSALKTAFADYAAKYEQFSDDIMYSERDPLLYALQNLDPSHMNVMVLDTLGLPEINSDADYVAQIQALTAQQPDLAIAAMVCRLDYAGLISRIGGHALRNGMVWGFLNYAYPNKDQKVNPMYAFTIPMPRPLLVVGVGPGQQVQAYMERLDTTLKGEMELVKAGSTQAGALSDERGDVRDGRSYQHGENALYLYNGQPHRGTRFQFAYGFAVMRATGVVDRQVSLASLIGAQSDQDMAFMVGEAKLTADDHYAWPTQSGTQTTTTNVPIITMDFAQPLKVMFDMKQVSAAELSALDPDKLSLSATIRNSLALSRESLSSLPAEVLRNGDNQAFTDGQSSIFIYQHGAGDGGYALIASQPTVADSQLEVSIDGWQTLQPGFYWVTLAADYQADPAATAEAWNPLPFFATPYQVGNEAPATTAEPIAQPAEQNAQPAQVADASDPAVILADASWDYKPSDLTRVVNIDNYLTDNLRKTGIADSLRLENKSALPVSAWGNDPSLVVSGQLIPTDIPPVFRVYQLNRIVTALREGLFMRAQEGARIRMFERQVILYVPLHQ